MIIDPLQKFLGATLGLTRDKRVVTNVTPGQHDGLVRNDGQFLGQTRPALWHPAGTLGGRFGTTEWSGNPWGFGTHGKPPDEPEEPELPDYGSYPWIVTWMVTTNNEWFFYHPNDATDTDPTLIPGIPAYWYSDSGGNGDSRWLAIDVSRGEWVFSVDGLCYQQNQIAWPQYVVIRKSETAPADPNEYAPYCAIRVAILGRVLPDNPITGLPTVALLSSPIFLYSNATSGKFSMIPTTTTDPVWVDPDDTPPMLVADATLSSWLIPARAGTPTSPMMVDVTIPQSDRSGSTDPVAAVSTWEYLWDTDISQSTEAWTLCQIETKALCAAHYATVEDANATLTLPMSFLTVDWAWSDATFAFKEADDDPYNDQYTAFVDDGMSGVLRGWFFTSDGFQIRFLIPGGVCARCEAKSIGVTLDGTAMYPASAGIAAFRTAILNKVVSHYTAPGAGQSGTLATIVPGYCRTNETPSTQDFYFDFSYWGDEGWSITTPSSTQIQIAMTRTSVTRTMTLTFSQPYAGGEVQHNQFPYRDIGGEIPFSWPGPYAGEAFRLVVYFDLDDLAPTWTWTQHEYFWSNTIEYDEDEFS